jgi:hypothetical protein
MNNLFAATAESTNPMETHMNQIVILGFAVLVVVVGGFFLLFAKMSKSRKK